MSDSLFRREAMQAHQTRWLGEVVLVQPVSTVLLTATVTLVMLGLVAFLVWGTYTKKTVVAGQLAPVGGLVKIYAPQPSIVLKRLASEGQAVKKGQVLYHLSAERQNAALGQIQAAISMQVRGRHRSLQEEIDQTRKLHERERAGVARKVRDLETEAGHLAAQIANQQRRGALAAEAAARYEGMLASDYITKDQLQQKQADHLEQTLRLQTLQREQAALGREIESRRQELIELGLRQQNQLAQLERSLLGTNQELAESESRREIIVVAPQDGTVTSVIAEPGQYTDPSRPLLSVASHDRKLAAYLYAPTKAIGFTKPGDAVLIRYQSYPYQKFGQHRGKVTAISNTALSPSELETIAGGIPGLDGTRPGELFYRITVELDAQDVLAYGQARPLQSGMTLEASILRDSRKLYEWVLEPLFTLRGRLQT